MSAHDRLERGSRWEAATVFVAALIVLLGGMTVFLTLVPACGMSWQRSAWFFNLCSAAQVDTVGERPDALRREGAALEREIAQLERAVGRLQCEPSATPSAPPPAEEEGEGDRSDDSHRARTEVRANPDTPPGPPADEDDGNPAEPEAGDPVPTTPPKFPIEPPRGAQVQFD